MFLPAAGRAALELLENDGVALGEDEESCSFISLESSAEGEGYYELALAGEARYLDFHAVE